MKILTAPELSKDTGLSVFLAGSIEMDKAEDWQRRTLEHLQNHKNANELTVFNPRRKAWDPTWKQEITNPKFAEQVNWELDHLDQASVVFIYFQPDTKSPISLMELGLVAGRGIADINPIVVVCPDGFWRRGNVQIVCERYGIPCLDTLDEGFEALDEAVADIAKRR
jgi:hypothetical protein